MEEYHLTDQIWLSFRTTRKWMVRWDYSPINERGLLKFNIGSVNKMNSLSRVYSIFIWTNDKKCFIEWSMTLLIRRHTSSILLQHEPAVLIIKPHLTSEKGEVGITPLFRGELPGDSPRKVRFNGLTLPPNLDFCSVRHQPYSRGLGGGNALYYSFKT